MRITSQWTKPIIKTAQRDNFNYFSPLCKHFSPGDDWGIPPLLNKNPHLDEIVCALPFNLPALLCRCDGQTSSQMDTTTVKRVVQVLVLFKRMVLEDENL